MNRCSAAAFAAALRKIAAHRRSGAGRWAGDDTEGPEIDVLLTGVEVSLWLAEQLAADLKTIFPGLRVAAISANKARGQQWGQRCFWGGLVGWLAAVGPPLVGRCVRPGSATQAPPTASRGCLTLLPPPPLRSPLPRCPRSSPRWATTAAACRPPASLSAGAPACCHGLPARALPPSPLPGGRPLLTPCWSAPCFLNFPCSESGRLDNAIALAVSHSGQTFPT